MTAVTKSRAACCSAAVGVAGTLTVMPVRTGGRKSCTVRDGAVPTIPNEVARSKSVTAGADEQRSLGECAGLSIIRIKTAPSTTGRALRSAVNGEEVPGAAETPNDATGRPCASSIATCASPMP
ncbi:hypothetical protein GS461_07865 [Rhodococcus hoagii]|nr:hypothetical protein [Prescottella equi]